MEDGEGGDSERNSSCVVCGSSYELCDRPPFSWLWYCCNSVSSGCESDHKNNGLKMGGGGGGGEEETTTKMRKIISFFIPFTTKLV